ncbi:MAG: alpha/beta fold hydrolase, partial [Ilumatobacteraceae bacterium]
MSSPLVVLVHGAWHGAWCWAPLQTELDRRGIASLAVDLPGHGSTGAPFTDLHGDAAAVIEV